MIHGHQLVSGRKHHGVPFDPEGPVEDDVLALLVIAGVIPIGFFNADSGLTALRDRPGQGDHDIPCLQTGPGMPRNPGLGPIHYVPLQGLTGHDVGNAVDLLFGSCPNAVEVVGLPGGGGGDVVEDPEGPGARGLEFVTGIVVGLGLAEGSWVPVSGILRREGPRSGNLDRREQSGRQHHGPPKHRTDPRPGNSATFHG